uniref:Uncharacterized protein n=1 Tax=Anopheles atroparvus TaxID=41427 RepID=A0AAG5DEV9_ANOAO
MKSARLLVLAAGTMLLLLLQTARDSLAGAALLSEVAGPKGAANFGAPLLGESVHAGDGSAAALLVLPKDSAPGSESSEMQPKPHPLSLESLLMPREKLVYAHRQHRTDPDEELEAEMEEEEDDEEENEDEEEQAQDAHSREEHGRPANGEDGDGEENETVTQDEMMVDSNESRFSFYSRPA